MSALCVSVGSLQLTTDFREAIQILAVLTAGSFPRRLTSTGRFSSSS